MGHYGFMLKIMAMITFMSTHNASAILGSETCGPQEICIIGSGINRDEALKNARSEMAKFFETKVKVDSTVTSVSGDVFASEQLKEWTTKSISEEADEILNGIEVKKEEQEKDHYVILVSLSKIKTAMILSEKIKTLDQRNFSLLRRASRFLIPQINQNLILRNDLFTRYQLVSNSPIDKSFTDRDLQSFFEKLKVIKLEFNEDSSISYLLKKILGPLKIVLVSKKSNKHEDSELKANLKFEEEYFKVEGFKKYSVILNLSLQSKNKNLIGTVSALSSVIARSKKQAEAQALPGLENQLINQLDQLAPEALGENL